MSSEESQETGMTLDQTLDYLDRIGRETDAHMAWAATVDGEQYGIMVLSKKFFELTAARDLLRVCDSPLDCVGLLASWGYRVESLFDDPTDDSGA